MPMLILKKLNAILSEVHVEASEARMKFHSYHSMHEGYAVLLEELEELWDEIKKHQEHRDLEAIRKELVQVASVAVLFLYDFENITKNKELLRGSE